MKLPLITLSCLLVGCAYGVDHGIDLEEEPAPEIVQAPPPKKEPATKSDCEVKRTISGNCYITEVICRGNIKRLDISCDHGRKLFPWEYIPDPAPTY